MTLGSPAKPSQEKLKIALIVDSRLSTKNIYDLAEWGQFQTGLDISHLIIPQAVSTTKPGSKLRYSTELLLKKGFAEWLAQIFWVAICKIETIAIKKSLYKEYIQSYDLAKVITNFIVVEPVFSENGQIGRFSDNDILNIKALNFDLLINCGALILKGDILNAARFGIISLSYGDHENVNNGPAGFWEVYNKKNSTGFYIQQLAEKQSADNVLMRGAFLTERYFMINQFMLYARSNFYMKKLLTDLAKHQMLPKTTELVPCHKNLSVIPNIQFQIIYLLKIVTMSSNLFIATHIQKKQQRWTVAFSKSNWTSLDMSSASKIPNPPDHFLADPFVITEGETSYCFVEDYHYKTARGSIAVYEIKADHAQPLGEALVETFHLSFPYLFRFNSKLYMVTESAENKDIRLYQCVNFPLQWQLVNIIMSDLSAADNLIFEYQGSWWLFSNINSLKQPDHCSELWVFYADNPVTCEWQPHPKNPVIINPANARNGGILFKDGEVYRVSQRHTFSQYGVGSSINRIVTLNKNEYAEAKLVDIQPDFFENINGTHHLHSDGIVTVFDFSEISDLNLSGQTH